MNPPLRQGLVGAMSVSVLRLPLTSVMIAVLLTSAAGLAVAPLIIVAVVVAYVAVARLPEPSTLWPRPAKAMKAAPSAAG